MSRCVPGRAILVGKRKGKAKRWEEEETAIGQRTAGLRRGNEVYRSGLQRAQGKEDAISGYAGAWRPSEEEYKKL